MNNRLRDLPFSRVFTTGFKLFAGLAVAALAAAFFTGFQACQPTWVGWEYPPVECSSDQGLVDSVLGPISLGWKGGVGDHLVFTLWVTLAGISLFLAGLLTAYRDADPTSVAEAAHTEVPPPANPPEHISYWPVLAAFSVAVMLIGLVVNTATFVAGLAALGVCVIMWTARNWADEATGDPDVNEQIHERLVFGLEVPLIALIIVGAMVISISRVLLAVGQTEAVIAAGVIAAIVFALGVLVAYVPRLSRNVVTIFLVAGAIGVISAGVVSAAQGEREFEEHHGEEHVEEGAEGGEGGTTEGTTETEAETGEETGN